MRRNERGFSLMEVTVVLAIVSMLMILVYSTIEQAMRTAMFNESHNDLAVMTQKAVNSLQTELLQTKIVFEENAMGTAYRGALRLPAEYPVWTDTLLPVIQPSVNTGPDTTTRFTGNSILLARQLAPLRITYDDDGDAGTPEVEFVADRYVFQYIYLTPLASPSFARTGRSLDLIMTASVPYADYFQLDALATAATARVATKLRAAGIQRAWDPGQPLASAFYDLAPAESGTFAAPVVDPSIDLGSVRSLLPGLRGGRISGRMIYSVAFLPDAAPPFPLRTPIRVFAPTVPGLRGFPSGFEVKIAGPTGYRQVIARLVLMSNYGASSYESQQGFVTTAVRF